MTITVLDNMEYGSDALTRSTYNGDSTVSWLSGWNYRKSITLSRSSGAVTNYQMMLLVGESSGATGENVDCNGHCLSSFNDLRFTKSDGTTLLDYWVESISGTTPNQLATVWIEFDSIGTIDTAFYMYYGNSGASSASNGDNTFPFFDDFSSNTLNTNKWDDLTGCSISDGVLTISSNASSGHGLKGKYYFDNTYDFSLRVKPAHVGGTSYLESAGFEDSTGNYQQKAYFCHISSGFSNKYVNYNNGANSTATISGDAENTWCKLSVVRTESIGAWYAINSVNAVNVTTNYVAYNMYPSIIAYANGASIQVDWVYVKKNLIANPSWGTWGIEIAYGTPIAYSESTNIIEGSYSLKAIAAQTTSLNKTLTRTISSPINLTGHAYIIGKIRASRTGSNIKIGFRNYHSFVAGGTASTNSYYDNNYVPANGCDKNESTRWQTGYITLPGWWKYDLGAGVTKTINYITFVKSFIPNCAMKDFLVQGSNDDITYTTLLTTQVNNSDTKESFSITNSIAYRYYKIVINNNWASSNYVGFNEVYMYETSSSSMHEITPNITAADTWQTIQLDISAVSDANKDAIAQIIITVVNADADNTFYLDNFFAATAEDFALGMQVSKAVGYAVLYPIANALNVSKVVAYAVLSAYQEPTTQVSKLLGYAVTAPPTGTNVSKLTGYAVTAPPTGTNVSKLLGYAVVSSNFDLSVNDANILSYSDNVDLQVISRSVQPFINIF